MQLNDIKQHKRFARRRLGYYISDAGKREEILNEIRSHILEKAEQEAGPLDEAVLEKVIAAYGRRGQVE